MITPQTYDTKLLSLKDHVIYIILSDPDSGKALGKILHPGMNKHFRASNSTAAHLLYLLSRPRHADIRFETMKQMVMDKYGLSAANAASELNTFLGKLDTLYNNNSGILDVKDNGSETEEPDPCDLFTVVAAWENPDVLPGNPPKSRDSHFFACGNAATSYRR
jgi:hypothetical protein